MMYHGDSRPDDRAADTAMTALYRQLDDHHLDTDAPCDLAAGLRRLTRRISHEAMQPAAAQNARQPGQARSPAATAISHRVLARELADYLDWATGRALIRARSSILDSALHSALELTNHLDLASNLASNLATMPDDPAFIQYLIAYLHRAYHIASIVIWTWRRPGVYRVQTGNTRHNHLTPA
jgi:hypothetical protein